MITNILTGQSVGSLITFHLLTVIAVYAALIFAARRLWLKSNEMLLIGGAIIFWAIAWILSPLIPIVRSRFPELSSAIPISLGLIAPFVAAMVFGLMYVRKKMDAFQAATADIPPAKPASPKSRKR